MMMMMILLLTLALIVVFEYICSEKVNVLPGRLPPIAVKLKGDTASTNPSKARYLTRLKKYFYRSTLFFKEKKEKAKRQ